MNKLNPSFKHHIFIGIFISLWVFVFTFYIRPFDSGTGLNFNLWWTYLSIGFGLIAFICYTLIVMFQGFVYKKIIKWNIGLEISTIFFFLFITLYTTYIYYKSPFLYGIWTFTEYANAFLKFAIIFTPLILFARRFIIKFLPDEVNAEDILTIKGEYKLDFLRIHKSELICISKSQNYIEVFFSQNGTIKSKLIRSSLKKMQQDLDFLIQVHRSHLINPRHFKSWKNQNTIFLNQIEIPVSKNYKDNILSL